jgi:hypothetical protein
MRNEEIRNKLNEEIEILRKKCRIENDEEYRDYLAEIITIAGGSKFLELMQKQAQLRLLDKITSENIGKEKK